LASSVHLDALVDLIHYRPQFLPVIAAACLLAASSCTSTSTSATAPSASKCQVSATASPMQFGAGGGSGTLAVTASRDCTWSVAAQASWIALSSTTSGNGDASLSYTVAQNPVPSARAGELVVASQRIQLSQAAAACTYSLDRSSDTVPATGADLTVQLSTLTGCAWSASSNAAWLTVSGNTSGTTSGSIHVIVAANTAGERSGAVTVGGQTYTVTQAAAVATPAPTPNPTPTPTPEPTPSPTPTPDPKPSPISLSGTVSALAGTCPLLQFSVSGRTVKTGLDTTYSRGRCGDLSNRDTVTVDGLLQADGTVTAQSIRITKNEK
jgi:hypothetical protein